MASSPVRFGLVGYGFGGRVFHAPLLASARECDLVGVVTTSAGRRAELAEDLPGVPAFDSLDALAGAGVEAVAISTPAPTHVPLAQEALERGLAVVIDKPFALDAEAARDVVELAARLRLPLSVYQNRRWDADLLTVRALVESGELGRVTRFESRFERFAPDPGPPAAGGGTLLDFGSHLVDQALLLFGPGVAVHAEVHRRDDLDGRDDDVFVAIHHDDGVRSHLWGSWVQAAPGPRFRVTGTEGTYVVDGLDGQEEALLAGRTPASEHDGWGVEPQDRWGWLHRGQASHAVPTLRGRWDTYYPAFAAAVRGEGPVPVDPMDAVRALEVIDGARRLAAGEPRRLTR